MWRDPCDGCDGTCGDVCPVMKAQRLNQERVERRLWRIDLNNIEVVDETGRTYEITAARGVLNGTLTVSIASRPAGEHREEGQP